MKVLTNLDLNKNELQNVKIQNLATAPANPVPGQIYYNAVDKTIYVYNGTAWLDLGVIFANKDILDAITAAYTTEEKTKLSGVETGANKYVHPSTHSLDIMTETTTKKIMTDAERTKLSGVSTGANKTENSSTNGNIKIDGVEQIVYTHPAGTNPHGTTKSDVGLGSVDNKSSATIRSEITSSNVTTALGFTPVKANGVPEVQKGLEGARPTATGSGNLYFATDTKKIWQDTATNVWTQMGGQDVPIASENTLGVVKIGANLSIDEFGNLNANDNPASFIRKQERFITTDNQTVFNLTKGTYKPNTGAITWFLNGDKQDDKALNEISSTSVGLPTGLPEGMQILFEYYEVINWHPFPGHASEHLTGGVDAIPKVTTTTDGLMAKEDKVKLNGVAAGATKAENSSTNGNIKINGAEQVVYTHPSKHAAGEITQDANNRFVTDTDKSNWNSKAAGTHNHTLASLSEKSYNSLTDKPSLGTASNKNTGTEAGQVPILDSNGKLDTVVLPAIAISETYVVSTQAAMLALVAETGDVCVRTDLSKSFILKSEPASTLANWQELLTPSDVVQSVAGKTGVVTLTKSDVGLSNVDNIQQATKAEFNTHNGDSTRHITAAERSEWDTVTNKVDKVTGKGLSTEDFTTALLTKLNGIATGAQTNQNAFSNVKVGATIVAADSATDTLEIVAGTNISITPDATNDKITINNTYSYTHPSTHPASIIVQDTSNRFVTDAEKASWNAKAETSTATTSANGLMSSTDKTKLDGIAVNANNYVHPNDSNTRHVTDSEKASWNSRTKKYAANIGNGTATEFTITHSLGTKDLTINVEEVATGETVLTDILKVDVNNIKVLFATAPTSNQFRVTVTG